MRIAPFLIFGVFLANTFPCLANLGDTSDQCIARYGKRLPPTGVADPGKTGAEAALFTHDGYDFEVYFLNGVVACETISKTDHSLLSDKDKDTIVKSESTGGTWSPPVSTHGQKIWMRSDGADILSYIPDSPLIFVVSANYIQLTSKIKKASGKFPSEGEVTKFVVPGVKVEDVIRKFGVPDIRSPQDKDGEVLTYCPLPSREKAKFAYAGFEVFVKDGKVTSLSIIHGDHAIAN